MLHAVRDALNKARKNDREALAQDLKAVYGAETGGEAKEALQRMRERWGTSYPRVVARWETKSYALLAFLRYPKHKEVPVHHKPTGALNQGGEATDEGGGGVL